MYKLKKRITSEILENLGFTKKDYIISPEIPFVEGDNELLIGQIDDDGNRKQLYVYQLPKGFRFQKYIAVNYRGEVFVYRGGLMAGGIEIYMPFDNDFYFRETEEWKENTKNLLKKIVAFNKIVALREREQQ